ncbi:ClbS/DfsB family four-helix bundle protein [Enterococcus sp. BWM-S5]|uniref:ClbS/DfsB family four-helix bundle protein n=1 Tax=Enterococcus larvae TaxID=2794352 RepID=A0ABS4CH78_9ENTE|nr:ClbS/DfsB family four-helix bundle protein [Enterococcus larvae]MBP1045976.1 ClbS/DfsB family four-helix bundle protein [Enterococcus larvae]
MARPTTKEDLIETASTNYDKLIELLDSMTAEQLTGTFSFDLEKEKGEHWKRDRNIHDVLIHLYEWQQMLLDWVDSNLNGESRQFLKEGYNWRTYGAMNVEFVEKHKDSSYDEALSLLKESHVKVMKLAEQFSNDELFAKKVFPWVGSSALGSYFVSATTSHYEWALKKIRKYKKMTT